MRWGMRWAQILAILRLEVRRNFTGKRAIPVYLLAALPVLLFAAHAAGLGDGRRRCTGAEDFMAYAGVFQVFTLPLAVFFGCVAIFMNLFRGEVLEKSLHYYFLAPVRRDLLVAGKYLSGLVTCSILFCLSTLVSFLIVAGHVAAARNQDLFAGPALSHLSAYLGVTLLASLRIRRMEINYGTE